MEDLNELLKACHLGKTVGEENLNEEECGVANRRLT